MNEISISLTQAERLMDSILWVLAPYLDDNSVADRPWLAELADNYNELYKLIPNAEYNYEPVIY
jgi:hypothetical protein